MKQTNIPIAIKLTGVSKEYIIHHEKPTLVEKFYKGKDETFWALRNINLTIKKGEKIGIIGPNGSGKTTLLKIIAGITTPTAGNVRVNGKVISLIDLEAGFHPDLTGYQNIFLNGMLLGMTNREVTSKLKSIIDFADIRQFIDAPLFSYSSGMKLRLGFSVALASEPSILILDEAFGVGDANFQKKAHAQLTKQFRSDKTIIVASHWSEIINTICTKVIKIQNGKILHVKKLNNL